MFKMTIFWRLNNNGNCCCGCFIGLCAKKKKEADAQLDMISNEPHSSLNCANMTLLRHMQEDMRGGEQTERGCRSC